MKNPSTKVLSHLRRYLPVILAFSMLLSGVTATSGLVFGAEDQMPSTTVVEQIEASALANAEVSLEPPVLHPLSSPYTKEQSIIVRGQATPLSRVIVRSGYGGGVPVEAAETIAYESGAFSLEVFLDYEGEYTLDSLAEINGLTSDPSVPVTITVDRSAPGSVVELYWEQLTSTSILIRWQPPADEYDPISYRIYGKDGTLIAETAEESGYAINNLSPAQIYEYEIRSADGAGNESESQLLFAGTSPVNETKLTDASFQSNLLYEMALSGDGSTVAYIDTSIAEAGLESEQNEGEPELQPMASEQPDRNGNLYIVDTSTKQKELISVTPEGEPLNKPVRAPAISQDGKVIAFTSKGGGLTGDSVSLNRNHIYVIDRTSDSIKLVSDPDMPAAEPSVSGDGAWIAFAEAGSIYLYNRETQERRLISRATGEEPLYGSSSNPVISADGGTIAYLTEASDLLGGGAIPPGSNAVVIYSVSEERIIGFYPHPQTSSNLSINSDGKFVAYTRASESHLSQLFLIDTQAQMDTELYKDQPAESRANKDYFLGTAISGDGRYVFTGLTDYSPQAPGIRDYIERFDRETGFVSRVGNPAKRAWIPKIDEAGNRIAYLYEGAIYASCYEDCGITGPENPIFSAQWLSSAEDKIGGYLKPGRNITVQALGQSDLAVEAVIRYRQVNPDDPDGLLAKQTTIPLAARPATPGTYRGDFLIADGIAEITSISVQPAGGEVSRTVGLLPAAVAGVLTVNIETKRPDKLEGMRIILEGSGNPLQEFSLSGGITQYTFFWPPESELSVKLKSYDGKAVLDSRAGLVLSSGRDTSILMTPSEAAALTVTVRDAVTRNVIPGARVVFKDNGTVLADVTADSNGKASLPLPSTAGKLIEVSVQAPSTHLDPESSQTLTLKLGMNEMEFLLNKATAMMTFDKQVGNGEAAAPVIGSNGLVRVTARPGQSLQAKISFMRWGSGDSPVQDERTISLTESAQHGQYEAVFLVEEGMSRIEAIQLRFGAEWSSDSHPVGKNIAARLNVSLAIPNGSSWSNQLDNTSLFIWYFDNSTGVYYNDTRALNANSRTYTLDVPYANPSTAYQMSLSSAPNRIITAKAQVYAQGYGKAQAVQLIPNFLATLTGTLQNEQGKQLQGKYTLIDSENNTMMDGMLWGPFNLKFYSPIGSTYQLKIVPTDPGHLPQTEDITIDKLDVPIDAVMSKRPEATLKGRVLEKSGAPAIGARVTATVVREGYSNIYTATTGAGGQYSITLPAGRAEVRASGNEKQGDLSPLSFVDIAAGETAESDLSLLEHAKLDYDLYTRDASGNWQGPMDIGWTELRYHGITSSHYIAEAGPPLRVHAVTGDTVRICVAGTTLNVPYTCKEVTIGSSNEASLEMRLENTGSEITFGVVKPNGDPAPYLNATFTRLEGGNQTFNGGFNAANPTFTLKLLGPGTYRMAINENTDSSANIEFTVNPGQKLDLGILRLAPRGKFGGQRGNQLTTAADRSTPSGFIELRTEYAYVGNATGTLDDVRLVLELPSETEAVNGTLVVNGKAGTADLSGRSVVVPLGQMDTWESGSVRLRLKISEDSVLPAVNVAARIRYRDGSVEREEMIGNSQIQLYAATLRAPEKTTKRQIQLNGNAPSGEQVTVYDGNEILGTTTVSPHGTWNMFVELVDNGMLRHRLRTETTLKGARAPGQSAVVRFLADDPGLETVTMKQSSGGKLQIFHPEEGTAIFPYTVSPGNPFTFTMLFRDPNRVYDVQVQFGNRKVEAQRDGELYKATLAFPAALGPVYITYQTKSDPNEINAPVPSVEQVRNLMPEAMNVFESEWTASSGEQTPDGRTVPVGTAASRIKLSDNVWANVTLSRTEVANYSPVSQDVLRAERSGRAVYGLLMDHSVDKGPASLSFTAYFPTRTNAGAANKSLGNSALAINPGAVKVTFNATIEAINDGTKVYDTWSSVKSLVDPSVFERIDRDLATAMALCDPQAAEYYTNMAKAIRFDIAAHEITKSMLNGVGGKLPGFGALIFWVESQWAGKELDRIIEDELKELEDHLKQYDCSKVKPWKEPDADPRIIWDPSGFVYEGLPSNVLEGVKATALFKEEDSWKVWDAEWYGQINPQITDPAGRYGWDVPEGLWKVRYEKENYETAYSDELQVPPPHFDVNIPLVSYLPPEVLYVKALPGGTSVEVGFSKPMTIESIREASLTVENQPGGLLMEGAVRAKDPVTAPNGQLLTQVVVFEPSMPFPSGTYKLTVAASLTSYAGTPLSESYVKDFLVEEQDLTKPSDVTDTSGGIEGSMATLMWQTPKDNDVNGTRIRWKKERDSTYGAPMDVVKGLEWTSITGLDAGEPYDFLLTAVDESGNESSGVNLSLAEFAALADLTPPVSALDLKIEPSGSDKLDVSWTDPASSDLAKLRISWQVERQTGEPHSAFVNPGVRKLQISELAASTKYMVRISAIDTSGNESTATSLTATTAAVQQPGGNPGPGTSPDPGGKIPGNTVVDPLPEVQWTIGLSGGTYEAFEGRLTLQVQKKFDQQTMIRWIENVEDKLTPSTAYLRFSPTYTLIAEGIPAKSGMLLTISYDPAVLNGEDPRRLGLYRKDSLSKNGWTYIGGVVNASTHQVTAPINLAGDYAVMRYANSFTDMASHWSRKDVDVLVSRHLVNGITSESFEPNRRITRAEMVKLLGGLLRQNGKVDVSNENATPFADVPDGAWFAADVRLAAELGLVSGAGGKFRPNDAITREELASLLVRLSALLEYRRKSEPDAMELDRFADASAVSGWAKAELSMAVGEGWLQGSGSATLHPRGLATRAESASLLLRVMTDLGAI